MKYDSNYVELIPLPGGQRAIVRLIRPEDRDRLEAGFHQLSSETRFYRFFTAKDTLTEEELKYLTETDGINHVAFGAALAIGNVDDDDEPREGEGLAVARFVRLENEPTIAEAAIVVADAWKGQGLGRLMFQRLIEAALERGIEKLRCEVLAKNDSMRHLLRKIAPEAELEAEMMAELTSHGNADVLVVDLPLPKHTPEAGVDWFRVGALYDLLQLAAQQLVIVRRAVDWWTRLQRWRIPLVGEKP